MGPLVRSQAFIDLSVTVPLESPRSSISTPIAYDVPERPPTPFPAVSLLACRVIRSLALPPESPPPTPASENGHE